MVTGAEDPQVDHRARYDVERIRRTVAEWPGTDLTDRIRLVSAT